MKRRIAIPAIQRHLPAGHELPALFAAFTKAAAIHTDDGPWFQVVWSDPTPLQSSTITAALSPFLRLGDGGVVAFWNRPGSKVLPVVHLDSEGGAKVVAATFADFLGKLAKKRTGVGDLDDCEVPLVVKGAAPRPGVVTALQRAFVAAVKAGETPTSQEPKVDRVRGAMRDVAARMMRDGLSKTHTSRDDWDMHFTATRAGKAWRLTYLDYGAWKPVPKKYGLEPLWLALHAFCKKPSARTFAILVSKDGMLSVDRDRQLVTFPGGVTFEAYLAERRRAFNARHGYT